MVTRPHSDQGALRAASARDAGRSQSPANDRRLMTAVARVTVFRPFIFCHFNPGRVNVIIAIASNAHRTRSASSASCARSSINSKKSGDWLMTYQFFLGPLTSHKANPVFAVGRMIEHTGKLLLRKTVGSGMIR